MHRKQLEKKQGVDIALIIVVINCLAAEKNMTSPENKALLDLDEQIAEHGMNLIGSSPKGYYQIANKCFDLFFMHR